MDRRKLFAILEEGGLKGSGPPSGTPSRSGLIYTDTSSGVRYLSRNVFNATDSSVLALPTVSVVRSISIQFKSAEVIPAALRQFHNAIGNPPTRCSFVRAATTGFLTTGGLAPSLITYDGATITSGTVNPTANVYHRVRLDYPSDGIVDRVFNFAYFGQICNVQIGGVGGPLRSYSIDEGSGTNIIDSVSGQNGTLTIGSGSWQLDWVPL
jgi:hypothetical protein